MLWACCLIWQPSLRLQASLERVGLDASAAVARARARSASRVGRKRARSIAAGPADMDVDAAGGEGGSQAPAKKRIHSSKARCGPQGAFPRSASTATLCPSL
jgi:hypothetical protein